MAQLKISQLGTMAGTLAGAATYSSLIAVGGLTSTVLSVALDTGSILLSKGAGRLLGTGAEVATAATCKLIGGTAATATTAYGPMVATAAAAVVGLTTSLVVTGGEYLVGAAIGKIHAKYTETVAPALPPQPDQPLLLEDKSEATEEDVGKETDDNFVSI
jgi:hypothetical protein